MAEACLALAVLALSAYAVLGGADLGAGFWDLVAGGPARGGRIRGLVVASMSPVWEANHVWLPFLLVVLWTCFPVFFASVLSTLWVPFGLAVLGLILRGAAFAIRGYATRLREGRLLGAMFAGASVLVPFCLAACVGAIASGRVPAGNAEGEPFGSWLAPLPVALGVLGIAAGAHLSAVFMTGDAQRRGLADLEAAMRRRALGSGVAAGALALAALVVARGDARPLFDGLTSGAGLACVVLSGLAGVATLGLVARGARLAPRFTAAAAVAFIVLGWAAAQSPDLLPGELTFQDAAAGDATLLATLVMFGLGSLVLVPSLVLLYRLTLRGDLDKPYAPVDLR